MKTLVLMMLAVSGDNVGHLNSAGVQLSITPMRYESLEDCNEDKPLVERRVTAWVRRLEIDNRRLGRGEITVRAACEVISRETGQPL